MPPVAWSLFCVLAVLVAGLTGLYAWYCWTNRTIIRAARALPTLAQKLPIIGMSHHFTGSVDRSSEKLVALTTQPGHRPTCIWFGPKPYIILHRDDDVETFLIRSKCFGKSNDYELLKFAFGDGLLTASGDVWKKTRRYFNPLFHARNISYLAPRLNDTAKSLVADLRQNIGKKSFDVFHSIAQLSLQNICGVLVGSEHVLSTKEMDAVLKSVDQLSIACGKRVLRPQLWSDFVFNLLHKKLIEEIHLAFTTLAAPIIKEGLKRFRQEFELEDFSRGTNNSLNTPKDHANLLTDITVNDFRAVTGTEAFFRLQELDPKFNIEYMKNETFTLIGTGTDTVAVAMASCLVALGTHPHIQDKVYEELIEVLGEHFDDITIEDTNKLSYLDQVLKETMRVFFIVPFVMKKADKDIQLEGVVIPRGSTVLLSLSSLARDPKTFPAPHSFDPDHFSPQNVATRQRYSFLPFSGGARDCIGKHYAMIQMKITISHILKEYRIISDVDIHSMKFKYALLLNCVDGYKIKLDRRSSR